MAGEAMSAFVRFFVKDEVSSEAAKVERSARDAADGMDEAADSAGKRLKDGFEKAKSGAATLAKGLGAVAGVAAAGIAAAFALAGEETANYTQGCNMLAVSAEKVGVSQEEANKAYQNFLGLTGDGDQATEAAQDMLNLAEAGGDIDTWYNIAAGTVARFGDALPVENLIESANETIRTGQIVGSMADAVNWASASAEDWKASLGGNKAALAAFEKATADGASAEDAFNAALAACSDESERAEITQKALNQIYGETGKAFQETNKDIIAQRQAQDNWNAAVAEAAEAVRPFVTTITELGAAFLSAATPYIQEFGQVVTEKVKPALEDLASAVLPPIQSAFGWLKDNLPVIAPIVTAIAVAFAAYQGISAVINGIQLVIGVLRDKTLIMAAAQAVLNGVMALNPFVLVAALIAALVAAIVVLWNTNEGFRNAVTNAWNAIKSTASSVFTAIASFLSNIWKSIKSTAAAAWNGIKDAIGNAINAAKTTVTNIVNGIKTIVSSVFNAIKSTATSIWNGIKSAVSNAIEGAKNAVSNAVNGIKSNVSSVFNGIKSTASSVWNGIKSTITNAINGARDGVQKAIDKIKGFFDFEWKLPELKLPHFKISGKFSLDPPSVPSFGIDWYAKGAVLDAPTIFGMNGSRLMGGGEAGAEAVAPVDVLMGYVRQAVREVMGDSGGGYVANINVTTGETDEAKLARLIAREQKRNAYALGAL